MVFHRLSLALLFPVVCQAAFAEELPSTEMPSRHAELLENHCLDCHDSATKEANIDLESLSMNVAEDMATAELWSKVLGALNSGEMPPEDSEPLRDADKLAFLEDLSEKMVTARLLLSDSGGDIMMRRLNRREYANTMQALLGVRPDVTTLPDDQATAGFDTAGASLFLSSDQIEQYHSTAIANLQLLLSPRKSPESKTVRIQPEEYYTPHYTEAAEQMRDIGKRANAFLSQSEKPASEFGLLDAYQAKKQKVQEWLPLMEDYMARPETQTGITLIMTIKQGGYTKVKLPTQHPDADGKYHVRVRAAMYPDADERHHYLEFSSGFGTGRKLLGWRKVSAPMDDPQIIDFEFTHEPGAKQQVWIHQRSHQDRGDKNLATLHMRENGIGTPPGIWIDWVELNGPLPSDQTKAIQAARDSILFEHPSDMEESEYASEVIRRFASRAFRGSPPAEEYLRRLRQHYQTARDQGQSVTEALVSPLSIVMASPSFLYQVEESASGQDRDLSPKELAVRLSYFLWSAPPDKELMALSESGELSDPSILAAQTERMLRDPRSKAFIEGFVHQWLQMERLDMFQFNGADFPNFDNAVRENARQEIFETFAYLLESELPLENLLKADFVVINDLLAGYYGIEGVEGHEFRKVAVPDGSLRGGLLGTAAVLAMGSDGQRSSPVERGAWVLRHLLNDPPPPAPPNVPQLSRLAGETLPARELARAHQEQPQCANCHHKIDPIGFGLENFDAAGQWRDQEVIGLGKRRYGRWQEDVRFEIDPAGKVPNGKQFSNFLELRDAVAEYDDEFARGFTEALIAYGLGRPFGFTDQELASQISLQAKQHHHSIVQFIHALIQSPAFQTR
ncbi:putative signal peptide and transmembrane protein [Rhodopirellula islandica]|uniref:Signal peptide and transmembrane protein n=1 Tax=Rhodopirellula islandica TaxID=595434 RepID=A0A0J1BG63_RHOIS|nr:DUF1592 domain-containing protein [Rhodopirellula islandica]KLU05530.1 putative signal peptide and transmembrane protein [Rhodopirellula islandica]